MNETLRYIIGYLVGALVFFVLIPVGFFELSKLDYLNGFIILINSTILKAIAAFLFFSTGMFFVIWSNIFLFTLGKGGPADGFGVSISPQTKKLVTRGPYRYSRNPMVFGALSTYLSLAVYLNSFFGLLAVVILFFAAGFYLKYSEEKRLVRDFGSAYLDYRKKVPMIFPYKRSKK